MAILCPKCGHQYDVTLFEFGNIVKCDCGARIYIDPQKGVILKEETTQQETKDCAYPSKLPVNTNRGILFEMDL